MVLETMKALTLENYPSYYFTDTGVVYSRISNRYHNKAGRIRRKTLLKDRDGYLRVGLFDKNGFNQSHIRDCCRGVRNFCGGYQWQYKE